MKRKCSRRRAAVAAAWPPRKPTPSVANLMRLHHLLLPLYVEETDVSRRYVPNNPTSWINIFKHMFRQHFGTFPNLLSTPLVIVLNFAVCLCGAVQGLSDKNAGMDCRSCAGRVGLSLCGHAAHEMSSDAKYPARMVRRIRKVYIVLQTQVWCGVSGMWALCENSTNCQGGCTGHWQERPRPEVPAVEATPQEAQTIIGLGEGHHDQRCFEPRTGHCWYYGVLV
jgi:hypothetical protein